MSEPTLKEIKLAVFAAHEDGEPAPEESET